MENCVTVFLERVRPSFQSNGTVRFRTLPRVIDRKSNGTMGFHRTALGRSGVTTEATLKATSRIASLKGTWNSSPGA